MLLVPQEDVLHILQKLPTSAWGVKDIEEVLSQAYVYQSAFAAAKSHLS